VAGDASAAAKARPPPADSTKRTPSNLPRTQKLRRHTPPGGATRSTQARSPSPRPTALRSIPAWWLWSPRRRRPWQPWSRWRATAARRPKTGRRPPTAQNGNRDTAPTTRHPTDTRHLAEAHAQNRKKQLPHAPWRAHQRQRLGGGCHGAGAFGQRGDGGGRPRCGGQISLVVHPHPPPHAQQPTPHTGTQPTHATGPGHTPNTGSITSRTPDGAQNNTSLIVVVAAASAALSDVVTSIWGAAAAGKSARRRQAPTW